MRNKAIQGGPAQDRTVADLQRVRVAVTRVIQSSAIPMDLLNHLKFQSLILGLPIVGFVLRNPPFSIQLHLPLFALLLLQRVPLFRPLLEIGNRPTAFLGS